MAAMIGKGKSWLWWLAAKRRGQEAGGQAPKSTQQPYAGLLLSLWFALTVGGYVYYNLTFVQHQGRYLFPALIPIGLAFAIGWWQVLDQIKSLVARRLSRAARDWTPWLEQAQLIIFALIFIYLARLDLVALQRYIIPTLSP